MTDSLHREIWKPVAPQSHYEVSNRGRVRSWKLSGAAAANNPAANNPKGRSRRPRILKASPLRSGHLRVTLSGGATPDQAERKDVYIHQLVAWAFLGPQPESTVIRHLDGNPSNNHVDNLTYGTQWDNHCDQFRPGSLGLGTVGIHLGSSDLRQLELLLSRDDLDEHVLRFLNRVADKVKRSITNGS